MSIWLIIFAVAADLIIGDPVYRFHPVRLIGSFALMLEKPARKIFRAPEVAGLFTAILTIIIPAAITLAITDTLIKFSYPVGCLSVIFFVYSSIACKDMIKHSKDIFNYLSEDNLLLARAATSRIVGRDTRHLSEKDIIRATVESIGENTVDGVLAPLFYAFIGNMFWGIEGAAVLAVMYRSVNTLDSSFGYKNERYRQFGKVSARTDDIFNFIPARLSFIIITCAALLSNLNWKQAFRISLRDHSNHASPNSGYPEAAYAGALGLKFGGETLYQDKVVMRPELGDALQDFSSRDIIRACTLLFNSTLITALSGTLILFLLK